MVGTKLQHVLLSTAATILATVMFVGAAIGPAVIA
jgi:hypothetical protein